MNERKLTLRENPAMLGMELYIYTRLTDGKIEVETQNGDTLERKVYERGEMIPRTLFLSMDDLQDLADELRRINVRPREAGKTEGLLEAQSEHLKDLRKLLKL